MEVDLYTTNKKLNNLLGNELVRQKRIFQSVKFYAYMNDRIIHGIEAYYDRRGLYDIENKLLKKDELMNNFENKLIDYTLK